MQEGDDYNFKFVNTNPSGYLSPSSSYYQNANEDIPIILVGNKVDLANKRKVFEEEGKKKQNNMVLIFTKYQHVKIFR